jgi:hypothetical protein
VNPFLYSQRKTALQKEPVIMNIVTPKIVFALFLVILSLILNQASVFAQLKNPYSTSSGYNPNSLGNTNYAYQNLRSPVVPPSNPIDSGTYSYSNGRSTEYRANPWGGGTYSSSDGRSTDYRPNPWGGGTYSHSDGSSTDYRPNPWGGGTYSHSDGSSTDYRPNPWGGGTYYNSDGSYTEYSPDAYGRGRGSYTAFPGPSSRRSSTAANIIQSLFGLDEDE